MKTTPLVIHLICSHTLAYKYQMHTFCESLMVTNAQTGRDELRTPQHKTYCEQLEKRQFSGSGRPHHPSRS